MPASLCQFVLFPFMSQGHMIPMIDIARLLAERGPIITIVTTPHNASRFDKVLARARESGLEIRLIQLKFPCEEAGLPHGCENMDMIPSTNLTSNFFNATKALQEPVEKLFEDLTPSQVASSQTRVCHGQSTSLTCLKFRGFLSVEQVAYYSFASAMNAYPRLLRI